MDFKSIETPGKDFPGVFICLPTLPVAILNELEWKNRENVQNFVRICINFIPLNKKNTHRLTLHT
jgi:hypothetical protein